MFLFQASLCLIACYFQSVYIYALVSLLSIAKLIAYSRSSPLELHYDEHEAGSLGKEFVERSQIRKMRFEPYLWAPHCISQGFFYLLSEMILKRFILKEFNREEIILPDGATIGLDWDGEIPDPSVKPDKPYLLICPGLGGDSRNLYSLKVLYQARSQGYKVATILARGAGGLKMTTPKLNCAASWRDIEHAIDYFYEKYGCDAKTKEKHSRIYAYGVSQGAMLLALYLGRAGKKTSDILDGASVFSSVWNADVGGPWFINNWNGFYNKVIGLNLNKNIK